MGADADGRRRRVARRLRRTLSVVADAARRPPCTRSHRAARKLRHRHEVDVVGMAPPSPVAAASSLARAPLGGGRRHARRLAPELTGARLRVAPRRRAPRVDLGAHAFEELGRDCHLELRACRRAERTEHDERAARRLDLHRRRVGLVARHTRRHLEPQPFPLEPASAASSSAAADSASATAARPPPPPPRRRRRRPPPPRPQATAPASAQEQARSGRWRWRWGCHWCRSRRRRRRRRVGNVRIDRLPPLARLRLVLAGEDVLVVHLRRIAQPQFGRRVEAPRRPAAARALRLDLRRTLEEHLAEPRDGLWALKVLERARLEDEPPAAPRLLAHRAVALLPEPAFLQGHR